MAVRARFTRIPKVEDLVASGVPAEAISTYCALSDYANNKSGLCWPKMGTLAKTLGRSIRTVQRHLHLLKDRGLIEFVERRRNNRGKFSSYLYRVVHIRATTTGHGSRGVKRGPNRTRTKRSVTPPISPPREGYNWLFDKGRDPQADVEYERDKAERRKRASENRREGYEWLFG